VTWEVASCGLSSFSGYRFGTNLKIANEACGVESRNHPFPVPFGFP
jgi:hypothetical protein